MHFAWPSEYQGNFPHNIKNMFNFQNAFIRMLTLFESIYTLKGRYNIGNVGQTASIWVCLLSLQNCFYEYAYFLWIKKSTLNYRHVNVAAYYSVSFTRK